MQTQTHIGLVRALPKLPKQARRDADLHLHCPNCLSTKWRDARLSWQALRDAARS